MRFWINISRDFQSGLIIFESRLSIEKFNTFDEFDDYFLIYHMEMKRKIMLK